jgi:hypothetical protein
MVAVIWATGMSITPPSDVVALHEAGVQLAVTVPAHAPDAVQVSPVVQAMPSSQGVPAGAEAWVHPVAGTHASWVQGFPSSQLCGAPPVQAPAVQVWPVTHRFVEQGVPLATGVFTHAPITTVSVVHGFMSSQLGVKHVGWPPTAWQAWFFVAQGLGTHGSLVQPPSPSS